MRYEATLMRGQSYTVFGYTFQRGVPGKKLLDVSEKEYLETNAVHTVKAVSEEGLERIDTCMFRFEARPDAADYAEDDDAPAAGTAPAKTGTEGAGEGGEGSQGGEGEGQAAGAGADGGQGGEPAARKRSRS